MNEIEMVEARESLGLLDHIPIGMFVLREDFVVLFWNGCLEDWTGISRSEIVGVDIGTLFPHLSDPKYVDRLRSVFEGGSPVVFSSQLHQHIIPVPLPDGRLRVQHTTVTSIPASDGAGFHALFAIQDVTNLTRQTQEHRVMLGQAREEARERGRAEEALRASEERFKQFFEYEPGYCYIISPDGVILDVNNAALEALGYEEEEIVGKPQEMIYAPDSLLKMEQLFARWKETGEFKDEETVIITKNGDRRNVILSTGAVKGQDGEVLHSVSVQRDITEHKWAEEALRESEARYRTLFDSAGDAIFIYDLEGYFLGVNQVACERLGYSQEELLQMTAMDIGSPEYTNLMPERVEQLRRRGQTFFETAHVCQDGTIVPVELNSRIIEYRGISAVLSIARDITGRKQAEEALRQSEERYRAVAEAAVAGIIIVDTKRNLTFVNPAFAEMVGYPQDDLLGMNLSQLMNPEEFARFQKQTLRSNKGVRSHYETTLRRQDGIALSVIASASPLTASDGSFQGTLSVVVDITERKQSEKALRASEALYHSTIEAMDDAIHVVDTDLRFILFNTAFRQWVKELDLETTSEVGRKLVKELSLLPDQILDEYRQVFKTGETLVTEDTIEIAGQGFFTETRKIPVFEGGRVTRVVTVVRDITERKRAEGALKKAYDELELRVEERTAELTVANEQLGQEVNERKRVEEALQRQLEELIVLHTIATAAAEATDEDALIERAVQAIGKIFYPDNFGVLLLDETTGVLHAHTSYQVREGIEILTIPPGCGITGQVAVTGLPMRVPDVTCEPAYLEGDPLTRSELCVPLKAGEQILGVINVESTRLDALSEADERLLTTFAGQLATAIEKVRLMGTLEQRVADRTRELTALYDVTTVAGESMDLRMTLEQSLERALVAMRSNAGAIHLLDEAGKALRLAVQQGISPDFAAQIHTVPSDNDLADWVIKHHEPLVVSDLEVDPRNPQATSMPSCHTYIGVPMRARRQVLGVLSVVREAERQFNVEEVALLASIADHVAVAVENARLRQRAQRAAVIEERERLARELHDSVTQSLYSLTLFAEAGRELAGDGRQEQVQHYLSRIGDTSQQALKEMRLLVHELRPYALERKGLVEALRQRLESVEKRSGVEACLLAEELIELKAPVEEGLYRIAQEALNNSLKHAAATSVTVCVHTEGEVVELEVVDDGIGFALDAASGSGGLGLTNMRDRAERMGGTLTILSVPGEGTRVMVKLEVSQ